MADRLADGDLPCDLDNLRAQLRLAVLHMRGAAERLEAKGTAQRRADERARRALGRVAGQDPGKGFDPRGYFVYLLWGSSSHSPLYVGQSTNVLSRLGSHLSDQTKRSEIERVVVLRCADRRTMVDTELQLIRQFKPPWNVQGLGRDWARWAAKQSRGDA